MFTLSANPVECVNNTQSSDKQVSRYEVRIKAPINIALIKYWGKRNEDLILPLNDSISVSINQLTATSTISIGPHLLADSVTLNGKAVQHLEPGFTRFRRVFEEVRRLAMRKQSQTGCLKSPLSNDGKEFWHIKVVSQTNFPIAAGLASSAAGFAAIACGLGQIFQLNEKEITRLARIGSGSACRSVKSGFVHWKAGQREQDDGDCICETIAPSSHWPNLRAVIVVVNEMEKKVGSSEGMRNTLQTSSLLQTRVQELVPQRVKDLTKAINSRNFEQLAQITMADSNQLHAICMDTYPPLNYLNQDSYNLMEFVHAFNTKYGVKLAYTFDAGPNCCLILEEETQPLLLNALKQSFNFDHQLISNVQDNSNLQCNEPLWSCARDLRVRSVVCSQIGIGPKIVSSTVQSELPAVCQMTLRHQFL